MTWLRWSALWFVTALLLFGAVSEVVFRDEFSTRFNFIAVDYLIYTQEVVAIVLFLLSRKVRFSTAPR